MRFIWYAVRNTKYGKTKLLVLRLIRILLFGQENITTTIHAITETFVSVHLGANTA